MKSVLDQLSLLEGKPIETLSPEEARKQPTPTDADLLGTTAKTIETRVYRARKTLLAWLSKAGFLLICWLPYMVRAD